MHHARGIRNGNYGAIFKIWDRAFGTLHPEDKVRRGAARPSRARRAALAPTRLPPSARPRAQLPYWMEVEAAERAKLKLSKAAAAPDSAPVAAAGGSAKKSRRASPRRTAASPAQRAARAYAGI
jgi:hypothetical protein